MKVLSADGNPLPRLATKSEALVPEILDLLDEGLVARPSTRISGMFWNLTHLMHTTLLALNFENIESREVTRRKRSILNNVELMMHWAAALNEYLGLLLRHSLPASGKKNKSAEAAKDRLDARIKQLFKMPINLAKHNSFGLSWIEMRQDELVTHGYFITGPIGKGTFGPAKFRPRDAGSPEGYSFALILREAFLVPFEMSDIAESFLDDAGLFTDQAPSTTARHVSQDDLAETLTLLNGLPLHGFPDEKGSRVPVFDLVEGSLAMSTAPLRRLPGTVSIKSELPMVRKGGTYRLPYFSEAT